MLFLFIIFDVLQSANLSEAVRAEYEGQLGLFIASIIPYCPLGSVSPPSLPASPVSREVPPTQILRDPDRFFTEV